MHELLCQPVPQTHHISSLNLANIDLRVDTVHIREEFISGN